MTFQSSLDIIAVLKVLGLSPVPGFCDDTQRRSEVLLIAKCFYLLWDELKLWWDKTNMENQRTRRQTWRSTTSSITNPA
jgi:hypothetical protein